MKYITADLHMHGTISFSPKWLKSQGYLGKNILKELMDQCESKNLDLCAITSAYDKRLHDSPEEQNRFNYLLSDISNLPQEYFAEKLGDNIIHSQTPSGREVYFLNGQSAEVKDSKKYIELLVVGTNRFTQKLDDISELSKICNNEGFILIPEHPGCTRSGGIGFKRLEEELNKGTYFTGIEGNSELIFPLIPRFIPLFGEYSQNQNKKAEQFAKDNNVSYVTTSDAHRIGSVEKVSG
jgi:histidinol phosphatase-like PHP family hydrolase